MKKINLPYKMLIYDIELLHLWGRFFQLKTEYINHKNLIPAFNKNHIVCIAWKWYDSDKTTVVDYRDPDMLTKFIAAVKEADVVLGKNNYSFDDKHINTALLLGEEESLVGILPDISDDLQHQMKKYFNFPSHSLEYISNILEVGSKDKMEESDWNDIENMMLLERLPKYCQVIVSPVLFKIKSVIAIKAGKKALEKMKKYNKNDVNQTEKCFVKVMPYIKLKHNASVNTKISLSCTECGSSNIIRVKKITKGATKYQTWYCDEHNGYAGKCTYKYIGTSHHPKYGKLVK